jgi:hypothetical protein
MGKTAQLVLLAGLLGLSACGGFLAPAPVTTAPPTPIPTGTPTIVWFPPTNTPPPLPTQTVGPTVAPLPGVGAVLFADDFSRAAVWTTATSSAASAVVANDRLVLSINGPGPLTLISLRSEPAVADFYARATVSLSLCQANDTYGMIFRAAAGDSYYRYTISCRGQVRLERARGGSIEVLQDWLPTGDAPLGAPAQVRVGVWAVANEMRFLLNDNLQFTAHDPLLHTGTLGFFIAASGSSPVTAAFSDLSVFSVTYASPPPTQIPTSTPLPTHTP